MSDESSQQQRHASTITQQSAGILGAARAIRHRRRSPLSAQASVAVALTACAWGITCDSFTTRQPCGDVDGLPLFHQPDRSDSRHVTAGGADVDGYFLAISLMPAAARRRQAPAMVVSGAPGFLSPPVRGRNNLRSRRGRLLLVDWASESQQPHLRSRRDAAGTARAGDQFIERAGIVLAAG